MAGKKNSADAARKQIPMRLGQVNWRRVQMAKVESGLSMQEMLWQALDAWLRKKKFDGLEREESEQ